MKQWIYLIFAALICVAPCAHAYDDDDMFGFDDDGYEDIDYSISDSGDYDINLDNVAINDGMDGRDVAGFDVAGVMLGMNFDDVRDLFFRGYGLYTPRRENSIVYTIHPDWKYNLDYECRQQGVIIPSELEQCINTMAQKRGLLYASEVYLVRENTGEKINIYFTSNATNNLVWRIVYINDVNDLEGSAEKFENQRQKKILAFWQNVLDKYGTPNSGTDKWLTTSNAYDPMLTAYYGGLDLVDYGRNASDQARNVTDAREHFQTKPYAF